MQLKHHHPPALIMGYTLDILNTLIMILYWTSLDGFGFNAE